MSPLLKKTGRYVMLGLDIALVGILFFQFVINHDALDLVSNSRHPKNEMNHHYMEFFTFQA
jgi:hypothetical protein